MANEIREIIRAVYRRGLQRNLGKKTLSIDQAEQAITKLLQKSYREGLKEGRQIR